MSFALRTLFAVIAGIAIAFVLLVAVEWFSSIVHPIPADFKGTIPDHVRQYPHWVLGVVVLAWGATALAAVWVASRFGNTLAGWIVALLLAWALVYNLTQLPYPLWFKIVMLICFAIACLLGLRRGKRPHFAPARYKPLA